MTVTERGRHAAAPQAPLATSWWAVPAAGAGLGLALFFVACNALPDDAFITASYARNLALRGEWALSAGVPANSATSPLNVLVLAGLTAVLRSPLAAVAVLLAVSSALSAHWLRSLSGSTRTAAVGVAVLLCSPLLASTVGLETYLAVALSIGLTRYAVAARWWPAGLLGGLAVTARPDLTVVVVVVLAVAACWHHRLRGPAGALSVAAVVGAAWPVFSLLHFGTAVSDTLPAKSVAGGWGDWTMVDGLGHYLTRWWLSAVLTFALLAVGAAALVVLLARAARRRLHEREVAGVALAAGGIANYAALSSLGVAPFFWYYAPLVAGLGLAAVLAVEPRPRRTVPVATAVLVLAVGVLLPGGYAIARGVPWDGTAPIRINWATTSEYRAIADGLPTGAVVESPGEVGVLAYYCGQRCTVVDYLADRGRMAPYIERYRQLHPGLLTDVMFAGWRPIVPVPVIGKIAFGDGDPPASVPRWPTTFPGAPTRPMWLEPR